MCLPREVYVGDGDRLLVRIPNEIDAWLSHESPLDLRGLEGSWQNSRSSALGRFASAAIELASTSSELCRLTVTASVVDLRGGIGLALQSDHALTEGLVLFVDAGTGRVTLADLVAGKEADRAPEPLVINWIAPRSSGELRIDVYLRGDMIEIFVNRQVALTHRSYRTAPLDPIVFVEDGVVDVHASLATHERGA